MMLLWLLAQLILPTLEIGPGGDRFAVDIEVGAVHACMVYERDDYVFRNCGKLSPHARMFFPDWSSAGCNAAHGTCDRAGDWEVYARVGYPTYEHPDRPGWTRVEYRESNHLLITREE